jgi:hypothetical protein
MIQKHLYGIRPEFEGEPSISPVDGSKMLYFPSSVLAFRMGMTTTTIALCILAGRCHMPICPYVTCIRIIDTIILTKYTNIPHTPIILCHMT